MRTPVPKILFYPDPQLKRIAEPVDFTLMNLENRTKIVRKMAAALSKTTYGMRLGLAAPQIGVNLRIVIVQGNVLFNPVFTPSRNQFKEVTEGCYSVKDKIFRVTRAKYGWVKWTTINGIPAQAKVKGIDAIVLQHELDHLDGKCCPDVGTEITNVTLNQPKV